MLRATARIASLQRLPVDVAGLADEYAANANRLDLPALQRGQRSGSSTMHLSRATRPDVSDRPKHRMKQHQYVHHEGR